VVALIAGWVTTEVGRQPWVVFRVMRTSEAVTLGSGIPVAFASLVVLYAALAFGVWWVLRRLSRSPLGTLETGGAAVLAPAGFTDIPGEGDGR
jgi:cytochrome d ubiquinol oxidase subunit I